MRLPWTAVSYLILAFAAMNSAGETNVIDLNEWLRCPSSQVLAQEMLEQVNRARSEGRMCGDRRYAPAPPVAWNEKLTQAAQEHSQEMARQEFFSHTTPGGEGVRARVEAAGYRWQSIGENLSAGRASAEEVVAAWLESPGHCANIMQGGFEEIGAACARNPSAQYGTYWTPVLAAPR